MGGIQHVDVAGGVSVARHVSSLRSFFLAAVAGSALAMSPLSLTPSLQASPAFAQAEDELAPDQEPAVPDDGQFSPEDANAPPPDAVEVEPLRPGEAVVTRFPHTVDGVDAKGKPIQVIDINGISASIIDIRNPGEPPAGQHWLDEPQRMFVTAGEVGQVFGVALAQRQGEPSPTIFLSATAAFGLHRNGPDWMDGMWGPNAGPGTIYRLSADNGYRPEIFADVTLQGRQNTAASLGNIAYDQWHDRLFVSDLETGMIQALDAQTGQDAGVYDHGSDGRSNFLDVRSGQPMALDPVAFDPATKAQLDTCSGDFSRTPSCWNIADFRRRVWGLKVRRDENGDVRLYYSIWGSDAFGNAAWPQAGDDRRNAVWSVGITAEGMFDTASVRREFFMPAFWPSEVRFGDKAGNSNGVSDITFPECTPQNVMLVAERGGMRNLGLDKPEPFARPYESRVIRYEIDDTGTWLPKGRYDVGFHDRSLKDGEPIVFANAAGGVDFGYRWDEQGRLDTSAPSQSVWMTGDGLCSPSGPCMDRARGTATDKSEVHGLQGSPFDAIVPLGLVVPANADAGGLLQSYMIDTDINTDADGRPVPSELGRNDATKIGDVAIYQACQAAEPLPILDDGAEPVIEPEEPIYVEPPQNWPVHTLNMSHNKWASTSHRVKRSWHYRQGSWHDAGRSWHWREGSWHKVQRSWHRRNGSWHNLDRSWHFKSRSFHTKQRSWDGNHVRGRSFHVRGRTFNDGHSRDRSFHVKGRTWDNGHNRDRSFHVKGRTWDNGHRKGRSFHFRGRTWNDNQPQHTRARSFHVKGRTFKADATPDHNRRRSLIDNAKPKHLRARSVRDESNRHSRRESQALQDHNKPKHLRSRSRAEQNIKQHSKRESRALQDRNKQPKHLRSQSNQQRDINQHSRRASRAVQQHNEQNINRHSKRESRGLQNQQHQQQNINRHSRRESQSMQHNENQQQHRRRLSQMQ